MDKNRQTVTLRQAALIAGFCYLLMPVSFAEFYIYPKLVIRGDIAQTAQNISTRGGLFVAAILCYLITLVLDVIIAWSLYILVAPVSRAMSLLARWFRVVYTAIAFWALSHLWTVYRLLHTPDYMTAFGLQPLDVIGDSTRTRRIGLGDPTVATIPLSELTRWINLRSVFPVFRLHRTLSSAMACDSWMEDPGASAAGV